MAVLTITGDAPHAADAYVTARLADIDTRRWLALHPDAPRCRACGYSLSMCRHCGHWESLHVHGTTGEACIEGGCACPRVVPIGGVLLNASRPTSGALCLWCHAQRRIRLMNGMLRFGSEVTYPTTEETERLVYRLQRRYGETFYDIVDGELVLRTLPPVHLRRTA